MNKLESSRLRNSFMQKLDRDSRRHINCIRFGAESREHLDKKILYILKYFKGGRFPEINWDRAFDEFICEVKSFDKKFRADIVAFTDKIPTIIEIAVSESDESLEKKRIYWEGKGFNFEIVR